MRRNILPLLLTCNFVKGDSIWLQARSSVGLSIGLFANRPLGRKAASAYRLFAIFISAEGTGTSGPEYE